MAEVSSTTKSSDKHVFDKVALVESVIDKGDEQLMADYVKGDTAAFRQLYARYESVLYRFFYNGCGNETNARELFQDTWLRVVKASDQYDSAVAFKAWLFTIARNRLIDSYRRQATNALAQKSTNEHESDPDTLQHNSFSGAQSTWAQVPLTPEQIATTAEQSTTLTTALHQLPDAQREAVMLKHIAGFNIDEIANIQGEGAQTVKSRLRYAMVKLRQYLKEPS